MAKIFFNNPIIKHLKETTILNFFSQSDGKTIFVRDTREDIYRNQYFVYGDLTLYTKKGDYYIDIDPMNIMSGEIFGVYIGEGYDFEIKTEKEPIFIVRQKSTLMALGMLPDMSQGSEINETALGMFHVGTTITFKKDGQQVRDELTKKGWSRKIGPSDKDFGIITVEEAFVKKLERNSRNESENEKSAREYIERLELAKKNKELNSALADSLIKARTDTNEKNVYMFLASDIKELKRKKII